MSNVRMQPVLDAVQDALAQEFGPRFTVHQDVDRISKQNIVVEAAGSPVAPLLTLQTADWALGDVQISVYTTNRALTRLVADDIRVFLTKPQPQSVLNTVKLTFERPESARDGFTERHSDLFVHIETYRLQWQAEEETDSGS